MNPCPICSKPIADTAYVCHHAQEPSRMAEPELIAADHIRQLTEPTTSHYKTDRFVPVPNVTTPPFHIAAWTKVRENRTSTHPSLLDQLEAATHQSREGGAYGGGTPQSKPAARLDALATLARINTQSADLATQLGIPPLPLRPRLRKIGAALNTTHNRDTQTVRSWWVSARCITGWEQAPYTPHVPCPELDCERWDTIRIRLDEGLGSCIECGASWHAGTFAQLGDYIRWASEHLTGPRHWLYDENGYPTECITCLGERQAMAERSAQRAHNHKAQPRQGTRRAG